MSFLRRNWPALLGGAMGLAIAGYAVIYAPMKRNHDQCGRVTLCNQSTQAISHD